VEIFSIRRMAKRRIEKIAASPTTARQHDITRFLLPRPQPRRNHFTIVGIINNPLRSIKDSLMYVCSPRGPQPLTWYYIIMIPLPVAYFPRSGGWLLSLHGISIKEAQFSTNRIVFLYPLASSEPPWLPPCYRLFTTSFRRGMVKQAQFSTNN
jgi:hypothetical protein